MWKDLFFYSVPLQLLLWVYRTLNFLEAFLQMISIVWFWRCDLVFNRLLLFVCEFSVGFEPDSGTRGERRCLHTSVWRSVFMLSSLSGRFNVRGEKRSLSADLAAPDWEALLAIRGKLRLGELPEWWSTAGRGNQRGHNTSSKTFNWYFSLVFFFFFSFCSCLLFKIGNTQHYWLLHNAHQACLTYYRVLLLLRVSMCRRKEKKITPPKTKIKTATALELNIKVTAKHTTHLFFGVSN